MKNSASKKLLTALVASGILFQSSYTVFAAENMNFQLDQITVTASKFKQSVATTPVAVTVVTAKEIEAKGAKNVGDALQGVPGVNVTKAGGLGGVQKVYINGTDKVVYMVDGKRINLPQGIASGAAGFDVGTLIALENIERIEVVNGGGSALYGADAVGGVINIITKKGSGKVSTSIDTEFGNNNLRTYRIINSGSENGWSWFLSGNKEKTDGQRQNDYFDGKSFSGRVDKELSKTENITFNFDYVGSSKGLPGSLTYPSATDFGNLLRQNWGITYKKKNNNYESIVRYYDNNQTYEGFEYYEEFNHSNKVRALEIDTNIKLDDKNILSWGTQWLKEKVKSTLESNTERERTVKAVYVQNEYRWNKKWAMTAGLRFDDNSQYGTNWLPKVAFSYQADDSTNYFINWGKVFRAPSFDDLYTNYYGMNGNPNLRPEKGWMAQAGVKKKINSNNEVVLSIFQQKLDDAIKWIEIDPDTYQWGVENIDKLKATGVNLTYSTRWNDNFSTNISYTYTDSHKQDGSSIGQPFNSFSVGVNYQNGKYSHSLYSYYTDNAGTSPNQVPSYVIWNTNINYQLDKDTALYLNGINLFNKKYQPVAGYPGQERTISFGLKQKF